MNLVSYNINSNLEQSIDAMRTYVAELLISGSPDVQAIVPTLQALLKEITVHAQALSQITNILGPAMGIISSLVSHSAGLVDLAKANEHLQNDFNLQDSSKQLADKLDAYKDDTVSQRKPITSIINQYQAKQYELTYSGRKLSKQDQERVDSLSAGISMLSDSLFMADRLYELSYNYKTLYELVGSNKGGFNNLGESLNKGPIKANHMVHPNVIGKSNDADKDTADRDSVTNANDGSTKSGESSSEESAAASDTDTASSYANGLSSVKESVADKAREVADKKQRERKAQLDQERKATQAKLDAIRAKRIELATQAAEATASASEAAISAAMEQNSSDHEAMDELTRQELELEARMQQIKAEQEALKAGKFDTNKGKRTSQKSNAKKSQGRRKASSHRESLNTYGKKPKTVADPVSGDIEVTFRSSIRECLVVHFLNLSRLRVVRKEDGSSYSVEKAPDFYTMSTQFKVNAFTGCVTIIDVDMYGLLGAKTCCEIPSGMVYESLLESMKSGISLNYWRVITGDLGKDTLGRAIDISILWLDSVRTALRAWALRAAIAQTFDETTARILQCQGRGNFTDENRKKGLKADAKSKAYILAAVSTVPFENRKLDLVTFDFLGGRSYEVISKALAGVCSCLEEAIFLTDGYAVYIKYALKHDLKHGCCFAHVTRKFVAILGPALFVPIQNIMANQDIPDEDQLDAQGNLLKEGKGTLIQAVYNANNVTQHLSHIYFMLSDIMYKDRLDLDRDDPQFYAEREKNRKEVIMPLFDNLMKYVRLTCADLYVEATNSDGKPYFKASNPNDPVCSAVVNMLNQEDELRAAINNPKADLTTNQGESAIKSAFLGHKIHGGFTSLKEVEANSVFAGFYLSCDRNNINARKAFNLISAFVMIKATALHAAQLSFRHANQLPEDRSSPAAYRNARFDNVLSPETADKVLKYIFRHPEYFSKDSSVNEMSPEIFQDAFNDIFSEELKDSQPFRLLRELWSQLSLSA